MRQAPKADFFVFARVLVGDDTYMRLPFYHDKENYIGPEKWTSQHKLRWLARFARYADGIDLNLAGWLHDGLYSLGGTEEDRERADEKFAKAMEWLIANAHGGRIRKWLARIRASAYFEFVRLAGAVFFSYGRMTLP